MRVFYNSNCSKCRILEKALESHGVSWEKVEYLNSGLTREMVVELFDGYDGDWIDLVRVKEGVFKDEGLSPGEMSQGEMVDFLVRHPIAIQRPVVIKGGKIIIARDEGGVRDVVD